MNNSASGPCTLRFFFPPSPSPVLFRPSPRKESLTSSTSPQVLFRIARPFPLILTFPSPLVLGVVPTPERNPFSFLRPPFPKGCFVHACAQKAKTISLASSSMTPKRISYSRFRRFHQPAPHLDNRGLIPSLIRGDVFSIFDQEKESREFFYGFLSSWKKGHFLSGVLGL